MEQSTTRKIKLAIFASGAGSNAESIIQESFRIGSAFEVALVFSNNRKSGALNIAKMFFLPTLCMNGATHPNEADYARALELALREHAVDLVALAGFMKKIPAEIVRMYPGRILNIHPALLPKYGGQGMFGLHVHAAALAAGDRETGVTIHEVNEEYDKGNILVQERVDIRQDDTPESLSERVKSLEHELYPAEIQRQSQQLLQS